MKIKIGVLGRIVAGVDAGRFVEVEDDAESTGGFLIFSLRQHRSLGQLLRRLGGVGDALGPSTSASCPGGRSSGSSDPVGASPLPCLSIGQASAKRRSSRETCLHRLFSSCGLYHGRILVMSDDDALPRTRVALAERLNQLGVAEDNYRLYGAHLENAVVMDQRSHGWVVFYCERGSETDLRVHPTEAAACADALERLTQDENVFYTLVAGPALAEEADVAFDAWLAERGANRESILAKDWKYSDMIRGSGLPLRLYFVRITTLRLLERSEWDS